MANQSGPESCTVRREAYGEALTGETGGPAIEPRNHNSGMPMLSNQAEGNTGHGVMRQSCPDPARSETLCTPGSFLHGKLGDLICARCASLGRDRQGQKPYLLWADGSNVCFKDITTATQYRGICIDLAQCAARYVAPGDMPCCAAVSDTNSTGTSLAEFRIDLYRNHEIRTHTRKNGSTRHTRGMSRMR